MWAGCLKMFCNCQVLINLYDERQGGEELLTAPVLLLKIKQLKDTQRDICIHMYTHLTPKGILSFSPTHTYN